MRISGHIARFCLTTSVYETFNTQPTLPNQWIVNEGEKWEPPTCNYNDLDSPKSTTRRTYLTARSTTLTEKTRHSTGLEAVRLQAPGPSSGCGAGRPAQDNHKMRPSDSLFQEAISTRAIIEFFRTNLHGRYGYSILASWPQLKNAMGTPPFAHPPSLSLSLYV